MVRNGLEVLTAIAVIAGVTAGAAAPSASARTPLIVKPTQQVAKLLTTHKVISGLHGRRSTVGSVGASRPITGGQTVLPVIRRTTTKDGVRWLRVMLPGRPNGRRGWITQRGTVLTRTRWHLVVKTSARRVDAYRDGRLVRSFSAIVGKPATPTPQGRYFVEESIRIPPGSPGGPYALATSARSNVLQEFDGGPGQIGIHGVADLGGTLGTAVSHGCVRLGNGSIGWLAARIRPGVPVSINSS